MKHNIVIFFLSPFHKNANGTLRKSEYIRQNGDLYWSVQTNQSALRYLVDSLQEKEECLDGIFYFVSSKVKKKFSYIDEQGVCSHTNQEELFRRYLEQEYGAIPCLPIAFDDTAKADMAVIQVTRMADAIRTYLQQRQWQPEEVLLHADMTGGPRNASMMMLSVMQVLRYSGIQAGQVLYSDWHEESKKGSVAQATAIYHMFNLVSGADEFINFGSVAEIKRYFEKSSAPRDGTPLAHLLETMQSFSDAIRICRTHIIFQTVGELQQALEDFERQPEKTLPETLFSNILDVFKAEYRSLLQKPLQRLDIIKWCVRKGFLQQAMTMCTEWLPDYMVTKKICYPVLDSVLEKCTEKKLEWTTWQQYFINSYSCDTSSPQKIRKWEDESLKNRFSMALRMYQQYNNVRRAADCCPALRNEITTLLTELGKAQAMLGIEVYSKKSMNTFQRNYPIVFATVRMLWQRTVVNNQNYRGGLDKFMQSTSVDSVLSQLQTLSNNEYAALFAESPMKKGTSSDKKQNGQVTETLEMKWQRREGQYRYMAEQKIIGSVYTTSIMLRVLHDFFWIRHTRNEMNHAGEAVTTTADMVAKRIARSIHFLESLH